ncbi:MAG: DUF4292 domain-containing protein [bacterium]
MKLFLKYLLVMIGGIVFLSACVPSKPTYEERRLSSDRLIKNLEANRRKIKSFRGTGVLDIHSSNFTGKGNFEVLLKKPDSLKVTVFGPFGIEVGQALVTQSDFVFYDALQNNVYRGRVDSDVLQKIFHVNLSFEDLMDSFAGAVNLTGKLREEPDQYENSEEGYILTYVDESNESKSVFNITADDLAIVDYRMTDQSNKVVFEGLYTDFKIFDDVPVPYNTVINDKKNDQNIRIDYRTIEINKEMDDLKLLLPTDVKIVEW